VPALGIADLGAAGRDAVLGARHQPGLPAAVGGELRVDAGHPLLHRAQVLHSLHHVVEQPLESLGVSDRNIGRAGDGDGLELLAAHHGTEPTLTGNRGAAGVDGGDAREGLAGSANRERPDSAPVLGFDHLLCDEGVLAPQSVGRQQAHAIVLDQNAHGRVAGAGDDDGVVAGALELVAPVGADVRARKPRVGIALWAKCADRGTSRVGGTGAGERTGDDHQRVAWIEAADGLRILIPEDPGGDATGADVVRRVGSTGLGPDATIG